MTSRPYLTIVSGLPRSGTSLMMQMLSAGGIPPLTDEQRAADIDNPHGYYEFEQVKQLKHDTSWLPGSAGKVVKMVYKLLYDLPATMPYKIVFMCRNLDEVLASQARMLQRLGRSGGNVDPDKLKQLFDRQITDTLSWINTQSHMQLMQVQYSTLISDPVPVVAALSTFLDSNIDTTAMLSVIDPSLYRNRAT